MSRWWFKIGDAPDDGSPSVPKKAWTDGRGRTRIPLPADVLFARRGIDLRIAQNQAVAGGDLAEARRIHRQRVRLYRRDCRRQCFENLAATIRRVLQ